MFIYLCCDYCGRELSEPRGWVCIWRKKRGKVVGIRNLHHGCREEYVRKWLNRHIKTHPSGVRWYGRGMPEGHITITD
jgi:hypothetical protein